MNECKMSEIGMLHDLLAILHRDGGQHTQEVGLAKSFKEAQLIASNVVKEEAAPIKEQPASAQQAQGRDEDAPKPCSGCGIPLSVADECFDCWKKRTA